MALSWQAAAAGGVTAAAAAQAHLSPAAAAANANATMVAAAAAAQVQVVAAAAQQAQQAPPQPGSRVHLSGRKETLDPHRAEPLAFEPHGVRGLTAGSWGVGSMGSYMDSIGAILMEGRMGQSPSDINHLMAEVPVAQVPSVVPKEEEEEEEEFPQGLDSTLDSRFAADDDMMMDMSPATVGMWQHFAQATPGGA